MIHSEYLTGGTMIHIAPCQCALHVRVRELEAKLARQTFLCEAGEREAE